MDRYDIRTIALMGEHLCKEDYERMFSKEAGFNSSLAEHLWGRHQERGFLTVIIKADTAVLDALAKEATDQADIESNGERKRCPNCGVKTPDGMGCQQCIAKGSISEDELPISHLTGLTHEDIAILNSPVEMNYENHYTCPKCSYTWVECWDSKCNRECICGEIVIPESIELI